jgi:small subunit ribosomal protein S6
MRRYETVVILDPDLSEDDRGPVMERIRDVIPKQGGALMEIDEWGAKRMAYEIRKKNRGYYLLLDYCGEGAVVDELERAFRIDDRVLKYMTIVLDKDTDPEKVKAEKEEAARKKELAAAGDADASTHDADDEDSESTSTEDNEED